MTNLGTSIKYGDFAPGAKQSFEPFSSQDKFGTVSQLKQDNVIFPNYANPCELYQTALDGTATAFPSNPKNTNLGLWSGIISNDDGLFVDKNGDENPIVLTLTSEGQYSSQGLTFTFDTFNGIFANNINIEWFRVIDGIETKIDAKDFKPDSAFYFCRNFVGNYNKVVIKFCSLNMPKNRLKLRAVDFGYGTVFFGDELKNVRLSQSIDPLSVEIAINTCSFELDSNRNIEYSFQTKQPISVYFNDELKATMFVKKSKRRSKNVWTVDCEDYISLLDNVPFFGDIYKGKNALELIDEIFKKANVPYSISGDFSGKVISGWIPNTNCRTALMHVLFSIGAVVNTANSDVVEIFSLSDEISQEIPLERIMQGQSFEDEEIVTGVEISAHNFKESTKEYITVYDASESGGENILVLFNEPLHTLQVGRITKDEDGEFFVKDDSMGLVRSSGANHAVINIADGGVLIGYKYEHTTISKVLKSEVISANDIENVVQISDATLVNSSNIGDILDRCYNHVANKKISKMKIIEGKHEIEAKYGRVKYGQVKYGQGFFAGESVFEYDQPINLGEKITVSTEYLGQKTGRITKQSFSLNGGIIVKDVELR